MKKLIAILLLMTSLTLCIVSCGDDNVEQPGTDSVTADNSTEDSGNVTEPDDTKPEVDGTLVTGEYTPYY
jgi:hypothetical protein